MNLREKPFFLTEEEIQWVYDTLDSITEDEKIGQLFIMLDRTQKKEDVEKAIKKFHIGGCRYESSCAETVYHQNKFYQACARIPLLIAYNGDSGGNGACLDGTYVASAAACGASDEEEIAYNVGYVVGKEGEAVGCNWNFGPVCDIKMNWRNTIVNTRAYSSDTDVVLSRAQAFMRGLAKSQVAATAKHFPGDGVEELDQHLVMGCNNLSCEEWDASFGKVYKTLIEEDCVPSIMIGHIALPSYERKYNPEIRDDEILPATLSYNITTKLLREELGFQGLILSDASHMGGFTTAKSRAEQVPGAIAAGCDMLLFFHSIEEDFQYMKDGVRNGVISEERLNEAVLRILALKASLKLHEKQKNGTLMPKEEGLKVIGCEEHQRLADQAAGKTITLVKDTLHQLPVSPCTHKNAYCMVISNPPIMRNNQEDPVKERVREELTKYGYQVTMHDSYYDLVLKEGFSKEVMLQSAVIPNIEEFKKKYDVVFVFIYIDGFAQKNNNRLEWSVKHSTEIPWYIHEVPSVFVSLNYTNHLIDVPMAKTFINAYAPTNTVIHHILKKLEGIEDFEGKYEEQVFCDRWDTRI